MATLDRPRLRPLPVHRVRQAGADYIACEDPAGCFPGQVLIPASWFSAIVRHCNGRNTRDDLRAHAAELGVQVSAADLDATLDQLDRHLVLDGPTFRTFLASYAAEPVRPAVFAGRAYPDDPGELRARLAQFFADPRGSGPIGVADPTAPRVRAVLCPHIDFTRGGPTYTWSHRELIERSDADVFVILGVAHQGTRRRFALTRKSFATPLGLVETDRSYVDRIAALAGSDVFEDELAHRTEHSIEFQAVFLQALLGAKRPFRIVPILVGSFHDLMAEPGGPMADPEVAAMVAALRTVEAESPARVAYLGSIDLCHVGPEFGDPLPVDDARLDEIRAFDRAMLDFAADSDPAGWFGHAAAVGNRWRVCGLAATNTMLRVIGPEARGRLLRYDQAVDLARTCCVSFASVVFDQPTDAREGKAP